VVCGCDGSKSPGPDGFNFAFIKEFWDLLKGEIRIMFDQFHGNACLPKDICSYFLTLIPKVACPQSLGDFRPISLSGVYISWWLRCWRLVYLRYWET
jgi:hypothetical protein